MINECGNCNGTGYVREGCDGESPCEFCNHEKFVNWQREQCRQLENENQNLRHQLDKVAAAKGESNVST